MSKPLSTVKPVAGSFAERLRLALARKGKKPSPTVLEREFNLRWRGAPVSVNAARNWLLGIAVPTLDKLKVLALWLDVSEEWLRWGVDLAQEAQDSFSRQHLHVAEVTKVGSRLGAGSSEGRSPEESSLIQDFRMLLPQDKQVVRAVVETILRERNR
jgi:transcriptional regulator with XRE-family HTH domain